MVYALSLAIGILLTCFVVVIIKALVTGLAIQSRDRARYRQLQRARAQGRAPQPVEQILAEHWGGASIDSSRFKRVWISLASHLEIDPELLRPDDRLEDVMVSTGGFGPDSMDLADFLLDWLPRADPWDEVGKLPEGQDALIRDVVNAVISPPR